MQAFRLINRFLSTNTQRTPYKVKKHIFFDVYSRDTNKKLEESINTGVKILIKRGNKIEMHESHSPKPFINTKK